MAQSNPWWPRSPARRRLVGHIEAYRPDLEKRIDEARSDGSSPAWADRANDLLGRAEHYAWSWRGNIAVGYMAYLAAQRLEISAYGRADIAGAAAALEAEAASKLSGWRQTSVLQLARLAQTGQEPLRSKLIGLIETEGVADRVAELLAEKPGSAPVQIAALLEEEKLPPASAQAIAAELASLVSSEGGAEQPTPQSVRGYLKRLSLSDLESARVLLRHATILRDEGLQNEYRKNELVRGHLWYVTFFLLASICGILALAKWLPIDLGDSAGGSARLFGGRIILYVLLFGIVGASFSAFLSLMRMSRGRRIPELVAQTVTTVVRPMFGAGAAIVSYVLLASGIQNLVTTSNAAVLFVAFSSGFSERLIVRAAESVGRGEKES